MQSITYIKNLKISAKKLRFILPQIKKYKPVEALDFLLYSPKKAAKIFAKAIKSALNNAKNTLKVEMDNLRFKLLTVEDGWRLKRFRPGGRGTAKSIVHPSAHIKIVLEAQKPSLAGQKNEIKSKPLENKLLPKVKLKAKS